MNNQETIDAFSRLKLNGMAEAYKAMTLMPVSQRPGMELTAAKLAEAERLSRDRHKTEMYLKTRSCVMKHTLKMSFVPRKGISAGSRWLK